MLQLLLLLLEQSKINDIIRIKKLFLLSLDVTTNNPIHIFHMTTYITKMLLSLLLIITAASRNTTSSTTSSTLIIVCNSRGGRCRRGVSRCRGCHEQRWWRCSSSCCRSSVCSSGRCCWYYCCPVDFSCC